MSLHHYPSGLTAEIVTASPGLPPRPTLLLVHGMMAGAWQFRHLQIWFAARGFASVALNLRGHHGSRPVADIGAVSVNDYIDDALAIAATLDRPVVIGQSMGGLIAQRLAEEGVVRAAVLSCALPPRGIPWQTHKGWIGTRILRLPRALLDSLRTPGWEAVEALLDEHLPEARANLHQLNAGLGWKPVQPDQHELDQQIFNAVADPALRQQLFDAQIPESGRAAMEIALGLIGVDAGRVHCPVLSVIAGDDNLVLPAVGRALADKYGGQVQYHAGRGHYALVAEPGWEHIAAGIAGWLEQALAL